MHKSPVLILTPVVLAVSLVLGACGGTSTDNQAHLVEPAAADAPGDTSGTGATTTTAPAEPTATIARSDSALTVREAPDPGAAAVAELAATTSFGSSRALLVLDRVDGWLQVQVPARPNDSTGWVAEEDVELVAGDHRITVDLGARHLTVFEGDDVVLETDVAIGAPDAPTPTGTFALVDKLQAPDPTGAYGPFALGLGAFSDTYSEFGGGDGQIGIHGTNDPSSIGQAVSHGCIRVPNEVVTTLAELLVLGTPVTIT